MGCPYEDASLEAVGNGLRGWARLEAVGNGLRGADGCLPLRVARGLADGCPYEDASLEAVGNGLRGADGCLPLRVDSGLADGLSAPTGS